MSEGIGTMQRLKHWLSEDLQRKYREQGLWTGDTALDVWEARAADRPGKTLVTEGDGTSITYGEADEAANRLAAWLREDAEVEPLDVVSIQLPNWIEFFVASIACFKLGAVIHPLSRDFGEAELKYALELVGSKALICPVSFHKRVYENEAVHLLATVPSLRTALVVEKGARARSGLPTMSEALGAQDGSPVRFPEGSVLSSDPLAVLLTSGTTGRPKAVALSHDGILNSVRSFWKRLDLGEDDVMFMPAPLNHATGFDYAVVGPIDAGGSIVLQERFRAPEALEIMRKQRITCSMGATPFIHDFIELMEKGEGKPADWKLYVCGGAPVPGSLVKRAARFGVTLCECYGLTETGAHVIVPPKEAIEWDGRFSGSPIDGVEIDAVDEHGRSVGRRVVGEEVSRGPNVFLGYLNNPEATAEATRGGWFHSGDLGEIDEHDRLSIRGRMKEILVRGGENIAFAEVEEGIEGCPWFEDFAAGSAKDERLGERIALYVVPADGADAPTVAELQRYLEERNVPKRLWPERIMSVPRIPRTESGKVRRWQLTAYDNMSE